MSLLKTYSISVDVDGGKLRVPLLSEQIETSGFVTEFGGISVYGDCVEVLGTALADETALDALVSAHVAPTTLADNKVLRCEGIDRRTQELIGEGFEFDSHWFSLSNEAQTNWLGIKTLEGVLTWPMGITGWSEEENDHTYYLSQANLTYFIATGMAVIKAAVDSGRALKMSVVAATTQEGLDAVVDSR